MARCWRDYYSKHGIDWTFPNAFSFNEEITILTEGIMDLSGPIAGSPIVYNVNVDQAFNVGLALGYKDPTATGVTVDIGVKVPLKVILDALVAKANNPTITAVENIFLLAIQSYLATLPNAKA